MNWRCENSADLNACLNWVGFAANSPGAGSGTLSESRLAWGLSLAEVHLTAEPLLDPIERAATAQTVIRGFAFRIFLRADLDERELSVSLYHEILQAATVASDAPPLAVMDFNEADFETAAQSAHQRLGLASPVTLNQFLAEFGF